MSLTRPATSRILTSMLIEFEKTVQPEIQSPRAQFVGMMLAYLLQALITREGDGAAILRTTLPIEIDRLKAAATLLEDEALATLAEDLTAHAEDFAALNAAHERASTALEDAVQAVIRADQGSSGDRKAFVDALLASEVAYLDAIDPPHLAPGEAFSTALRTSDAIEVPAFNRYLGERFPGRDIAATEVVRLMGGFSKDSFIVSLTGSDRPADEVVIRRDAPSGPIDASVVDEYPVIDGLYRRGFPVAEPFWIEAGGEHFGSPFLATRRVPGSAPLHSDGVTLLVSREEGENAARKLARVLAALHGTDLVDLGYSAADAALPAAEHVLRLVDEFEAYWRPRKSGPEPIMAAAFEWLRRNVPKVVPGPSAVHGDASLRNLLVHQGEITAMLDWETVHIGDPSEDISYTRRDIELVMPWEDFLADYHAAGGPEYREENARFFELWSNVRNGAYSLAHGFEGAPVPDIRFAFSSAYYHRDFLRNIAAFLQKHG